MNLYIDIETIPSQQGWIKTELAKTITAPANYKKPESIANWHKENGAKALEDKWLKTSFDGSLGELVCIGWSINDDEPQVVYRDICDPEGEMLRDFFQRLKIGLTDKQKAFHEPTWIGHYITGFDLRFLWQRCVLNGVAPSVSIPYNAKPWDRAVFDTCIEWAGLQPGGTKSLDMVSKLMGYPGKGDIDGSKVWEYVKAGKIEEVAEYCRNEDVRKCRELHKRMTFQAVGVF